MRLSDLRRFAVARSLFPPTTLKGAIHRLGFVQADPIRAPARAQDLTLRHRVTGYRAGDLERRYATLEIEEDFFVNYGYVTRALHHLMHPRPRGARRLSGGRAQLLLEFVRARGTVHPREVDRHFAHGRVTNYWGGSSSATTHLLDALHYRGSLRVAGREAGIRLYTARTPPADASEPSRPLPRRMRDERLDRLIDVAVGLYAPLPAASLSMLLLRLRYGAPQWHADLRSAIARARERLGRAEINGIGWYWPAEEDPRAATTSDHVRLLAPFDPIVWDRRRFELFWNWAYRFEAYTPLPKRKLGYYALPLLWRDEVIGWSNLSVTDGTLHADTGYVASHPPRDRLFRRELDAELDRMRRFLRLEG